MDTTKVNELLASSTWLRRLARRLATDEATADDLRQDAWKVALTRSSASARSGPAWMAGVVRPWPPGTPSIARAVDTVSRPPSWTRAARSAT